MLSDDGYRDVVVQYISDPKVRDFWIREFPGYEGRFAGEVVAPLQNKVGAFLSPPAIRHVLGQATSTIDPRT